MFHGSIVALITPFRNGSIDQDALQSLVGHLEQGTHGLVGRHHRRSADSTTRSTSGWSSWWSRPPQGACR